MFSDIFESQFGILTLLKKINYFCRVQKEVCWETVWLGQPPPKE